MQTKTHPLAPSYLGTSREIVSFHYGGQRAGEKVFIQASLHADELPGMLVAHHLRLRLAELEMAGRIAGEIVVVPVANPVGLSQSLLRSQIGRFDAATGENFNRHYPLFYPAIAERLNDQLGPDAEANKHAIRAAMRDALDAVQPRNELEAMRRTLMRLACDADVALDLHCDAEAALHLYTGTPLWPQCEPLARYLGAYATLLATESGDQPFDEACSQTWWQLEAHFKGRFPVPMACLSVTVELRGQSDVDHDLARRDAEGIVAFLTHRGVIDGLPAAMPALKYPATPLAGSDSLEAPVSGVVVFLKPLGEWVRVGEEVAEIIDPLTGRGVRLASRVEGVLYARESRRFATAGMWLAKIAGAHAFRTGKLLGA